MVVARIDAGTLLRGLPNEFDLVELDPCGSVAELLPPAIGAVSSGGLLCATATDMGSLPGRYGGGDICARKYGGRPFASMTHHAAEIAILIVLGYMARAAATQRREILPLMSFGFADFYVRVIVRVTIEAQTAPAHLQL